MYNEYNSTRKNNYLINKNLNQYQVVAPSKSYRTKIINKSPNYTNQYRYEQEDQAPYINQIQYKVKRPEIYYEERRNNEKTMKNRKIKPDYYFSGFNSEKDKIEKGKNYIQKSMNNFTNQNQITLNANNDYLLEKNSKKYLAISQNQKDKISYHLENTTNNYKISQAEKNNKNYYRNNPLIKTSNYHTELGIEKENPSLPVAQKICNITIKGEKKKTKKMKSDKKKKKKFSNNIEIEEKVAQGCAIPDKKNNVEENKKIFHNNIKYEKEEKIMKINKEKKTIIQKNENNEGKNKEIITKFEKNNNIKNAEKKEIYEEDEEEEIEEEQQNKYGELQINNIEEQNDEGQLENEEQIEQYEEEDEKDINKRDIEELEEEEQNQIQLSNIPLKKIDLQKQKENDITLEGIKDKKPIMQIEKFQVFQESNKNERQKKNNKLNIIKDDNIEIQGSKRPLILEIKLESNVELNKKNGESIIKMQKVQSFQQPRIKQKQPVLRIIKNRENDVDIINENILEMQKVQNFEQPRDKKRKIKNKNIKFKISKNKDNNFMLEKIIEEPILEIEKVINYKEQSKAQKKKTKNIKYKISNIKDNNFMLEKIIEEPKLIIENTIRFQEQPKEQKRITKNKNEQFIITEIKDSNITLEKIKKDSELKIENAINYIVEYDAQNKEKNKLLKKKTLQISQINDSIFMLEKIIETSPKLEIENAIKYEHKSNIQKTTTKNKYSKNTITKIKDGNIEIISIPFIFITQENNLELKRKYKKSNYKKLKVSKKNVYQYNPIQIINDVISDSKESKFMIKGKSKKQKQKQKYITRREITYYYKSPISQKKTELSIGGKIKNTIMPTTYIDEPKIINHRKKSSKSTSSIINNIPELMKENKIQESNINKEQKKTYKISTIVSSNLISTEHKNIQDNQSERNKTDKGNPHHYRFRRFHGNSPNDSSKEKEKQNESMGNVRTKINNMISPIKNKEKEKNEYKREEKNYYQKLSNNYEQTNNNSLIKSENINTGRTQSYYFNKNNSNRYRIPKTPLQREIKNNNNSNKSHTATIISYNQEEKNIGRTYITSKAMKHRNQSNEPIKVEDNSFSNVRRVYKSNTSNSKNNDNERVSSNNVNTIYVSSNIKKNLMDDSNNINNNKNESKQFTFTSSTFNRKRIETKQLIDNKNIIINSRDTSSDKNKGEDKKDGKKANLNRIVVISTGNSPEINKNNENIEDKMIKPNNMFETFDEINTASINKNINNNNINKEEIINTNVINDINDNIDDNKKQVEKNNNLNNDYSDNNEIKKEDSNIITNKLEFGNSELSDITKSYLNSYLQSSRPELSDFSKQFLTSDITNLNTTDRPELSNITRAYLISQTPMMENEDEK